MNKQERQDKIEALLRQAPETTVMSLSAQLNVSQVTIRKDLTQMENAGILVRTYGRAVLRDDRSAGGSSCFLPPETRDEYGRKQLIGSLAGRYVRDEDFIFIGPGYTCLEVARNLRGKKRLSILTTNVSAAIELADMPEYRLQLVPGDFTKRNGTYYVTGPAVPDYLEGRFFDKIFLTVDGVSVDRGFSVLDEATARIFQAILKPGCEVFVCVTSTRFGKNALAPLGPVSLASHIVTDAPVAEPFRAYFEAAGVSLLHP